MLCRISVSDCFFAATRVACRSFVSPSPRSPPSTRSMVHWTSLACSVYFLFELGFPGEELVNPKLKELPHQVSIFSHWVHSLVSFCAVAPVHSVSLGNNHVTNSDPFSGNWKSAGAFCCTAEWTFVFLWLCYGPLCTWAALRHSLGVSWVTEIQD